MKQQELRYGALYIRVSSDKQEELSPDAQKRLGLEYAEKHNIFVQPDHIFTDSGISGRKADKRPEFQRMIAMAKSDEHPFSVILVWKFSRFARNQEESIVYKSMLHKQCDVDVISITEPLIDGPFGSLIERIIEWMDEYYSINLSGEVIRGMTEKAMRGGYQSSPCLGYASPGTGQPFVVLPDEAETVKYIFDQYVNRHRDITAIARSLNSKNIRTRRGNLFEKRNVAYILKNRFYIGKVIWNDIERDGVHDTFISPELFQAANDRLSASYTPKKRRNVSTCAHWLSGLVKCSTCGASLGYNKAAQPFFQCWKYAKGIHPGSSWITEKVLIDGVMEYFEQLLDGEEFTFVVHDEEQDTKMDEVALYKKELDKIDFRESRIREAYEAGIDTIEEYQAGKRRLAAERERIIALIDQASADPDQDPAADRIKMLQKIKTVYDVISNDQIDYEIKGSFIRSVVEEIVWNRKDNTLSFHLYTSR